VRREDMSLRQDFRATTRAHERKRCSSATAGDADQARANWPLNLSIQGVFQLGQRRVVEGAAWAALFTSLRAGSRHGPELFLRYLDAAWADCVVSVHPELRFFYGELGRVSGCLSALGSLNIRASRKWTRRGATGRRPPSCSPPRSVEATRRPACGSGHGRRPSRRVQALRTTVRGRRPRS
jgi:hypothetical protein